MFWTDQTNTGEPWTRVRKWRLVNKSVVDSSLVMIFPPRTLPKDPHEFETTQNYRAYRMKRGKAVRSLCEAPTLAECQALAVTLYKMEEP